MLRENPVVKKVLAFSEEQVGKIAGQLLTNEAFVNTMQKFVGRSLELKAMVDKSVQGAMGTMNIPTTGDIKRLGEKLDELEKMLAAVADKVAAIDGKLEKK